MSEQTKRKEKNFLVQGSILAIAGVITKIIGAVYRVPLVNILGDKGMGYYGVARNPFVCRSEQHVKIIAVSVMNRLCIILAEFHQLCARHIRARIHKKRGLSAAL